MFVLLFLLTGLIEREIFLLSSIVHYALIRSWVVLGCQLRGMRSHRGSIILIEAKLMDKSGISIVLSPSKLFAPLYINHMIYTVISGILTFLR